MQQLARKNPWKAVFVIVVFVFLTTTLGSDGGGCEVTGDGTAAESLSRPISAMQECTMTAF